jgi:2-polyprenyl-6-methoxyphenol hydroxylase-like FAD-dependent oxidoreductase
VVHYRSIDLLEDVLTPISRFYEVTDLPRWSSPGGRVIVMGDAAHAFSPQGGQGAAMAMEDAATLGMTISRPNFTSDRVRLLKAWQAHRQRRVQAVKAYTDGNGRLRTPPNTWFKRMMKEWIMWARLTWKGPLNGMEWLFSYEAEDVIKDLRA